MAPSRIPVSRQGSPTWWLSGVLVTLLIVLVTVAPLWALLSQTQQFSPLALLGDAYLRHVLLFSVSQALLSTFLSLVLAIWLASALARRRFWGRTWLLKAFALSQVLPVIIAIFGIVVVHGKQGWLASLLRPFGFELGHYLYGLFGILLAHVFFNMPLAARLLLQQIESIPPASWRLASQLDMRSRHIFWLLEWPAIRAVLPALAGLIFTLCFSSFTTVLALGGGPKATTLEVAIYQALRFDFDFASAAGLAFIQLLFIALLGTMQQSFNHPHRQPVVHAAYLQRPDRLHWLPRANDVFALSVGLAIYLPPLLAIIVAGLQPVLLQALHSLLLWQAVWQSLKIASAAGVLACLLGGGLLISSRHLRLRKQQARLAHWWEMTGNVILLLPTVVLSTGLFILLLPWADVFAFGPQLVILINALMALPYVLRTLSEPMHQIVQQYDKLAASLGIAGWHRLCHIEWPLLRRPLAHALALAMLLSLGDIGAIAMFGSQDLITLPWLLYQQLASYRIADASASALLLLLLCFALFTLIERGVGGKHADPR